jgi:signal transduction histidine kinase
VLVIDDQEALLDSTRILLEHDGHTVLTANSGAAGLALLREHDVHVVIVDYIMPTMNGAEVVRAVRTTDPHVQIILQTGYSGETPPLSMMKQLDIQGYHNKADGPQALLMWVASALKANTLIRRLIERERLLGELVANVSHEFRTPLNIIGGYAQLLADGDFGAMPVDAQQPLRSLVDTNRTLADLVDNFLQYARVDAGVTHVKANAVAIAPLVQEITDLAKVLVEEKGISVRVDVEQVPEAFTTDSVKLRTILRNLVVNAAKFTSAGEIAIRFSGEDGELICRVRDTGPGIPPDRLEAVFEPFRQLDGSATRPHGGVGLGLALARRLAGLLGGTLAVESWLGEGTEFSLRIPLKPVRDAAKGAESGRLSAIG